MSTQMNPHLTAALTAAQRTEVDHEAALENTAAAFGLSAAVTIVFNTALAWTKDAYDPLNSFMASLTGHHWRTHGLVDVILFLLLGWLFTSRHAVEHVTDRLSVILAASVIIGGAGLAGWFLLV